MDKPLLLRQLGAGLNELQISLSEAQQAKLIAYLELLVRWNSAYNLTAIRDPQQMVARHLLDSLAVLPHLRGECFIDVGTGPGLPGIPLAIACPDRHFTLLDSNGKKTRFLFQARTALELANVQEVNTRVEGFQPAQPFDAVLSRAFSSLPDMVEKCAHLTREDGLFLAMKGKFPQTELSDLAKAYKVDAPVRLQVPGVSEERHLIVIHKA